MGVDLPQTQDAYASAAAPAVELKGTSFTLPVLRMLSKDVAAVEADLKHRLAQHIRFFENAPVVIDLSALQHLAEPIDFPALIAVLRRNLLIPVGVRNGTVSQTQLALLNGLAVVKGGATQDLAIGAARAASAAKVESLRKEKSTATAQAQQDRDHGAPGKTKIVTQPVRSGQQIYAQGGDLVILGPVSAGAEVIADGNIHIYAPLRGRALAGATGNTGARIFAQSMEPELLSVAGHFRVFEDKAPNNHYHKMAQAYLEGDKLVIVALGTLE
ncbi:MAG: septum site-determining protein MinC [Pseudomonadota bacterium]